MSHKSLILPDCLVLPLPRQSHSVANVLASRLRLDPRCAFAGYNVPHPSTGHTVLLKVVSDSPEKYTPEQLIDTAALSAINDLVALELSLKASFRPFK
jgi:DNA-directed RNA polymerase subunit L